MDAACTIQDSIHVFSLVRKYVSRILGTYHTGNSNVWGFFYNNPIPASISSGISSLLGV